MTAKATHIFFSKHFQHICVSLDVNFNESLNNDVVSFEQLGPGVKITTKMERLSHHSANYNFISFLFWLLENHIPLKLMLDGVCVGGGGGWGGGGGGGGGGRGMFVCMWWGGGRMQPRKTHCCI